MCVSAFDYSASRTLLFIDGARGSHFQHELPSPLHCIVFFSLSHEIKSLLTLSIHRLRHLRKQHPQLTCVVRKTGSTGGLPTIEYLCPAAGREDGCRGAEKEINGTE